MNNIMGAALLGELLGALARSTTLRTSLEGIPADQADAVVRKMVDALERLAAEGGAPSVRSAPQKPAPFPTAAPVPAQAERLRTPFPTPVAPVTEPPVRKPVPEPAVVPRPAPEAPPVAVAKEPLAAQSAVAPQLPVAGPPPVPKAPPVAVAKEPVAAQPAVTPQLPVAEPPPVPKAPPVAVAKEPVAAPSPAPHVQPPPPREPKRSAAPAPIPVPARPKPAPVAIEAAAPEPPSPLRTPSARVRVSFDDETVFVLAAALISLQDTPAPDPFGTGAPGVERGSEIFAFDHAGMRFFLSTLKSQEASVSRTGMLLLGKQESIKHRGAHESLVNALRVQSLILPAEPGTVVFGRNDLVRRVDFRRDALFELLVGLSTLSAWRVHASVLDAHVQKILPAEAAPARAGRHDADRARVPATTKKTDIKSLERLLNREKKLAEAILQRLAAAAESHTVEAMVGLASGSSEDWKPILKASFEVPAGRFTRFAQAVVDCQEAHAMFEPMLSVVGGPGSFSLSM